MKKLLLTTVCVATLTLAACEKKGTEPAVEQMTSASEATSTEATTIVANHSNNNIADIQADLLAVQTLSNAKAQEAAAFQKEVSATLEKKDPAQIKAMVEKTETYVKQFNDELDALTLKSAEVDALREKMQDANDLGVELTKESTKTTPDSAKITELQNKATELQKSIIADVTALEAKVKAAPAP
ncbi:hypothetical protein N5I05_09265 [Acinetobacter johnsonii]|uniref:hypothetical protein n=1 Tax=Acinetobacter johnsonii TaxID=40214 RepID=UPI00244AA563|nr:hypothetical protein [Acinetobacter johnsonii]MDH1698723.1 hypothetical protein [Acinetobacter johnsonii]